MPDHLHLVVVATSERSDLIALVHALKQRTEFEHRRSSRLRLWQKGCFEHVLRSDESTLAVVKYVLENPVRAGLVREPLDYPFSGSFVFNHEQLRELWQVEAASVPDFGFGVGTP